MSKRKSKAEVPSQEEYELAILDEQIRLLFEGRPLHVRFREGRVVSERARAGYWRRYYVENRY